MRAKIEHPTSLKLHFQPGNKYRVWVADGRSWIVKVLSTTEHYITADYTTKSGKQTMGQFSMIREYERLPDWVPTATLDPETSQDQFFTLTQDQFALLEPAMREVGILPPLPEVKVGQIWRHRSKGNRLMILGHQEAKDSFSESYSVAELGKPVMIKPKDLHAEYEPMEFQQ